MTLWDFAVAAYGRPGAQAGWLALQDHHGQCVSFLLWRWWTADEGRPVGADLLARAAAEAHAQETEAISGLRKVRRALREPLPGVSAEAQAMVREAARRLELDAERTLLETLERMTPASRGGSEPPLAAVAGAAAAWGDPLDARGREGLRALLS